MEGLLARWALAIQEYDFTIELQRMCTENVNAGALSHRPEPPNHECAATFSVPNLLNALSQSQHEDAVSCQLHDALLQSATPPNRHRWSQ